MAWNGYIDSVVGASKGSCDQACIIGLNGASWTTADHANHLNLSGNEGATIGNALNTMDCTPFQASGIMVGGQKYQFLRADDEEGIVLGKKKDNGCITIHKSNTAIVIGHTIEGKAHGDTNGGVASIVGHLKNSNM